jgi:hypothetical protein
MPKCKKTFFLAYALLFILLLISEHMPLVHYSAHHPSAQQVINKPTPATLFSPDADY